MKIWIGSFAYTGGISILGAVSHWKMLFGIGVWLVGFGAIAILDVALHE